MFHRKSCTNAKRHVNTKPHKKQIMNLLDPSNDGQ